MRRYLASALATLIVASGALAVPHYSVRALPHLSSAGFLVVNDIGQVALKFSDMSGPFIGYIDTDGAVYPQGEPGGLVQRWTPVGFNSNGEVVGFITPLDSRDPTTPFYGAKSSNGFHFTYTYPQFNAPPWLVFNGFNGPVTRFLGINHSGTIIGEATRASDQQRQPFIFSGGVITPISSPVEHVVAINDSGDIAGWGLINNVEHALRIQNGIVTDVGAWFSQSLPSRSVAMNNFGDIVAIGGQTNSMFVLRNGSSVAVPGPPNDGGSTPVAIDNADLVYGNENYFDFNLSHFVTNGWISINGVTTRLNTLPELSFMGYSRISSVNHLGQVIVLDQNTFTYYLLTPVSSLTVNVQERLGLGPVPDGTRVTLLNNDGTALSSPTSATTLAGAADFSTVPDPTLPNTSYRVVVSPPAGALGQPVTVTGVHVGDTVNAYLTAVRPYITQSLNSAPPVAFARANVAGIGSTSGTNGQSAPVWLPDGSYGASFSFSPGISLNDGFSLGPTCSSNLAAAGGYAQLHEHLTRIVLTARTSSGASFIPTAGTWAISPGGLSARVNGSPISQGWWLPDGGYTGALSGAAKTGSSGFNVGAPTTSGLRTVTVGP